MNAEESTYSQVVYEHKLENIEKIKICYAIGSVLGYFYGLGFIWCNVRKKYCRRDKY